MNSPDIQRSRASSLDDSYLFTDLDFGDLPIVTSNVKSDYPKISTEFNQAVEFMTLATYYMIIAGNYAVAYLLVARLGGNVFMNGIILSAAEAASTIVTGIGLNYMRDVTVTRLCAVLASIFNLMYYFLTVPEYPLLRNTVLFFAMLGMYGPYNVGYVIFELRLPPRNIGAATSIIILFFGPLAIAVMPFVAIAPQPIPLLVIVGLSILTFMWTLILPEAGKYIPKLEEALSERKSIIDADIISAKPKFHESSMLPFMNNSAFITELGHDEKAMNIHRPSRDRGYSELYYLEFELQRGLFKQDSKIENQRLPTHEAYITPRLGK